MLKDLKASELFALAKSFKSYQVNSLGMGAGSDYKWGAKAAVGEEVVMVMSIPEITVTSQP